MVVPRLYVGGQRIGARRSAEPRSTVRCDRQQHAGLGDLERRVWLSSMIGGADPDRLRQGQRGEAIKGSPGAARQRGHVGARGPMAPIPGGLDRLRDAYHAGNESPAVSPYSIPTKSRTASGRVGSGASVTPTPTFPAAGRFQPVQSGRLHDELG